MRMPIYIIASFIVAYMTNNQPMHIQRTAFWVMTIIGIVLALLPTKQKYRPEE
jgi:hypothetical protein